MITVGVDAHKLTHSAHALDQAGRSLSRWQGRNTPDDWLAFADWLSSLGESWQVGIEGARSYGHGLAQFLVGRAVTAYDINPRWTARSRSGARRQHKTDAADAEVIARFVLGHAPDLPLVAEDDEAAALNILVDERRAAVETCTQLRNRLHAHLGYLFPGRRWPLTSRRGLDDLLSLEAPSAAIAVTQRSTVVRQLANRLLLALQDEDWLRKEIERVATARYAALTELHGVAALTAGMLAAYLGPGRRFASEAQLAAFAGVSPIETSSAGAVRHRLNRGGNRQLNAVIHRIAVTQAASFPRSRQYLARRRAEGRTAREAFRALKRHLVRAIFKLWNRCLDDHPTPRPSFA